MKLEYTIILACTIAFVIVITIGCMGPKAFNRLAKNEEKKSPDVVPYLKLKKGDTVADLGAGGGYFSFKLAQAVGDEGKIYAVDISKKSISFIQNKAKEKGITNVETVLATFNDSQLKDKSVDVVFIRNAYHDFHNRVPYFKKLKSVFKGNGRLIVIDYEPNKLGFIRRQFGHALQEDIIKTELKQAGYELLESHNFLKQQSFNIFKVVHN